MFRLTSIRKCCRSTRSSWIYDGFAVNVHPDQIHDKRSDSNGGNDRSLCFIRTNRYCKTRMDLVHERIDVFKESIQYDLTILLDGSTRFSSAHEDDKIIVVFVVDVILIIIRISILVRSTTNTTAANIKRNNDHGHGIAFLPAFRRKIISWTPKIRANLLRSMLPYK